MLGDLQGDSLEQIEALPGENLHSSSQLPFEITSATDIAHINPNFSYLRDLMGAKRIASFKRSLGGNSDKEDVGDGGTDLTDRASERRPFEFTDRGLHFRT